MLREARQSLDWSKFVRNRVSFFGSSNHKHFTGWLTAARPDYVCVMTGEADEIAEDTYVFQVFGDRQDVLFAATLSMRCPAVVRVDDRDSECLSFTRLSPFRFETVSRKPRRSVHGLRGEFCLNGSEEWQEVALQDISEDGAGFLSAKALDLKVQGILKIALESSVLLLTVGVINCKATKEGDKGPFRIGCSAEPQDRISTYNWKQLNQPGERDFTATTNAVIN